MTTTLIKNCRIVSPDLEAPGAAIEIEGTGIKSLYLQGSVLPKTAHVYDAGGRMAMPGFIDIHTHGAMGFDVMDGTDEAIETIAAAKLREGVTTFLPTTLTIAEPPLTKAAAAVARYQNNPQKQTARIPGLHLEGPFINPRFIGAQNPEFVRTPDLDEVWRLNAIAKVMIVSYAIEMEGDLDFTAALLAHGIVPSCAHSNATHAQFRQARRKGLKQLTHFCNQMSPLHHREIGLVGSGLLDDDVMVEAICDQIHLCPDMIKLIFKIKPIERIAVITDSMLASGLPDGEYLLGGLATVVKDRIARLQSNGALAGGTIPYYQAVKNIFELTGLPLSQLIKTTGYNQARSLGLKHLAKLEAGYTADIVILDDTFTPVSVWVGGEPKWQR
ncbi:MAG: N-acetylglucosamine-6-phosphate deacetylase [bacterium]